MALFHAPRGTEFRLGIEAAQAPRGGPHGVRAGQRLTMIQFAPRDDLGPGGFYETDDLGTIIRIKATPAWEQGKVRPWKTGSAEIEPPRDGLFTADVETVKAILDRLPVMPISADLDLDDSFRMPEVGK